MSPGLLFVNGTDSLPGEAGHVCTAMYSWPPARDKTKAAPGVRPRAVTILLHSHTFAETPALLGCDPTGSSGHKIEQRRIA